MVSLFLVQLYFCRYTTLLWYENFGILKINCIDISQFYPYDINLLSKKTPPKLNTRNFTHKLLKPGKYPLSLLKWFCCIEPHTIESTSPSTWQQGPNIYSLPFTLSLLHFHYLFLLSVFYSLSLSSCQPLLFIPLWLCRPMPPCYSSPASMESTPYCFSFLWIGPHCTPVVLSLPLQASTHTPSSA